MNDLRQLRHFVALAEHGHFARAAAAVHLSQPALSRSIQALEASLGCNLVDRHSRGISLTAHGSLVLEHARRLLAGSQALSSAVSQLGNLASGELRLGAGPYPAARLVPRSMGQFASAYPRVQVHLLIDNWENLRLRLLEDSIELFVADIRELQDDSRLHIQPLQRSPGVIFCRPAHPLLNLKPRSLADLGDYPLAGTQLPKEVAEQLKRLSGREQPLGIECDNFMLLKALVAESDVISMAPWEVVAEDVRSAPSRATRCARRAVAALGLRPGQPGRPEPVTGRQPMAASAPGTRSAERGAAPSVTADLPTVVLLAVALVTALIPLIAPMPLLAGLLPITLTALLAVLVLTLARALDLITRRVQRPQRCRVVARWRLTVNLHHRRPRITVLLHTRVLLVIGPWIDRLLIAIAGVTRGGITPVIHLVNGTTRKGQTQGQQG